MKKLYHKFHPAWWLLTALLLLTPTSRAQNVSVLGNVKTLTGVASSAGVNVRFKLRGYTGSVPRVSGTGVVLPTQPGCGVCIDVTPDAGGNLTVTIYGNDQITPAGTWYTVEFSYLGRIIYACDYSITGTQFNINTAACLSTTPQLASGMILVQSFVFLQSPAATTWTINHNLNDLGVVFDFYDSTNTYIIPDKVQNTSPNQTVATFLTPVAGTAVIIHAGQVSIATNQPNALLQNPPGNQTTQFDLSTTGSFTAPSFRSNGVNIAAGGRVRLASGDTVCWRNAANNADLCLNKDGSDNLFFGSNKFVYTTTANTWTQTQTFNVQAVFVQATGTAPFTVASTTNVPNLNASLLLGNTWAAPGPIGGTTPGTGAFSTVSGTAFTGNSFASLSAGPAASGVHRCASADACMVFRNNAGNGDVAFAKNASDQPTFGGPIVPTILNAVTVGHVATFANSGQIQDGGVAQLKTSTGHLNATSCTTASSTYSQCNADVTISPAMADTSYYAVCQGHGANDPRAAITDATILSTTSVRCVITTEGSVGVNYADVYVIATHP